MFETAEDAFAHIGRTRPSGTLLCFQGLATRRLGLRAGVVLSARSDEPTERIGQFLLSHGVISEEQLEASLEVQRCEGGPLGATLVAQGALEADALEQLRGELSREIVFGLFECDAVFELSDDPPEDPPQDPPMLLNLRADEILDQGVIRRQRWDEAEEKFLELEAIPVRTGDAQPPAQEDEPFVARIYGQIDGLRSLEELALDCHVRLPSFLVAIDQLASAGAIRVPEATYSSTSETVPLANTVNAGTEHLEAGRYGQAFDIFKLALTLRPDRQDVRELARRTEAELERHVFENKLSPSACPRVEQERHLLKVDFTAEEFYLLKQLNGRNSVRAVVDVAPLRPAVSLRLLARLLERRSIYLDSL